VLLSSAVVAITSTTNLAVLEYSHEEEPLEVRAIAHPSFMLDTKSPHPFHVVVSRSWSTVTESKVEVKNQPSMATRLSLPKALHSL
jgi:hypothetical protein